MNNLSHLSAFVKYHREKAGFTQEELAAKAGVGLRFIRDLEQGKQTLRIDKIDDVLALFGFQLKADRESIDPYVIRMKYSNCGVIITLKNKDKLYGIIINEITNTENQIVAWEFVPNNHAIEYQRTKDKKLTQKIEHNNIAEIDYQNS